jgi:hypothetical protein
MRIGLPTFVNRNERIEDVYACSVSDRDSEAPSIEPERGGPG